MFEPDTKIERARQFSRLDIDDPLSSCSRHPIVLEDKNWLTVEHYYSSKIIASDRTIALIEKSTTGKKAHDIAKPWYRLKVSNWKNLRKILMTRALYTKVQMYEEVREALLNSGDQMIVEVSAYDHFWGMGRDQRGNNTMGVIWMEIREKLREQVAGE
ncbi:MAG: ribA/ribD-fused uncharacterized protein [Flavobacteriales bacterium]|jgi:ribA/ribD-fused uncharacterized protein